MSEYEPPVFGKHLARDEDGNVLDPQQPPYRFSDATAHLAREQRIAQLLAEDRPDMTAAEFESAVRNIHERRDVARDLDEIFGAVKDEAEHDAASVVDSLDDMQPAPRAGKFFAELIVREDMQLDSGVILPGQDKDDEEANTAPKRARVLQLGDSRPDEPWDFKEGWHVIVPYHAGQIFKWINQSGVEESVWILDSQEIIALFRPR